jgi:hypothetical protein
MSSFFTSALAARTGDEVHSNFLSWKEKHGKRYVSDEEELQRLDVFRSNWEVVKEHNAMYARGEVSFDIGMNVRLT